MPKQTLFKALEFITDPRKARGVRHSTATVLKLVLLGFASRLVAIEHIINFFRPHWHVIRPELRSDRIQPPNPKTIQRVLEGIRPSRA